MVRKLKMLHFFHFFRINNLVRSQIRLPHFIVLAYLEVPKLAKPGQTDRQTNKPTDRQTDRQTDRRTEFAIAICHLVITKYHKKAKATKKIILRWG